MEVRTRGTQNPLIIISQDEVHAWLRTKADEAGFADRSLAAVQITVEQPFATDGRTYHHEIPSFVLMVSSK